MDFFINLDWRAIGIALVLAILLINLVQLVRYYLTKKWAERELKKLDSKVAEARQILAQTKAELARSIENMIKPKPPQN
jgi:hypothetical protein